MKIFLKMPYYIFKPRPDIGVNSQFSQLSTFVPTISVVSTMGPFITTLPLREEY